MPDNVVTDTNGNVLDQLYQAQSPARPQPQSILSGIGQALGVQDAMSAITGGMTPEEAQMFALGSVPMLLAPEAKVLEEAAGPIEQAIGSIVKQQKPGRWPTYLATKASGETQVFKDPVKAERWANPPEVMRPDPAASPLELPPWEEPIKAFHGSPHSFEQFDISKIGTGEGAQAYGHGLYFSQTPDVAKAYRDQLTALPDPLNKTQEAQMILRAMDNDIDRARQWGYQKYNDEVYGEKHGPVQRNGWDKALVAAQDTQLNNPLPGRLYEVNINADPEHFLDWDKPLSEQSEKLQSVLGEAVKKEAYNRALASTSKTRADELWAMVKDPNKAPAGFAQELLKKPEFVDQLRQAGIPGIKYLDQGSRGNIQVIENDEALADRYGKYAVYKDDELVSGAGFDTKTKAETFAKKQEAKRSYNFVVFDDKLIDIIKKYGIAGLIGAGASNWSPDKAEAKGSQKEQKGPMPEGDDYDFEAAKAAGVKPDARGHMPDTYKKPNHITFSDESIYNDGGAGHWEQIDKHWYFTPGPTNLKNYSMEELRRYFKKNEPDATLVEPQQAGEVVKMQGKNPYGILGMTGKTVEEMAEANKKNQTRATLMRALGGGADVLPIKPGD
jgi:hypothetical protein